MRAASSLNPSLRFERLEDRVLLSARVADALTASVGGQTPPIERWPAEPDDPTDDAEPGIDPEPVDDPELILNPLGRYFNWIGDINGDGVSDFVVADYDADGLPGEAYVVYGLESATDLSIDLESLNGIAGFRLVGVNAMTVEAVGDVNGDGFDDLLVGAWGDPWSGAPPEQAAVVFGSGSGFAASVHIAALNGRNGFQLAAGEFYGISVYGLGDVNGDGWADLGVTGFRDDAEGVYSGADFVLFGSATGFARVIDLAALDSADGTRSDWSFQFDDPVFDFGGWSPEMFARANDAGLAMAAGGHSPGTVQLDYSLWTVGSQDQASDVLFGNESLAFLAGLNADLDDVGGLTPIGGRRPKRTF